MLKAIWIIFTQIIVCSTVFAQNSEPTSNKVPAKPIFIDYAQHSTYKNMPLKNVSLNVLVFYNGNPKGKLELKTDDEQKISLNDFKDEKLVSLEILSIDDGEMSAHCTGNATPNNHDKVLIECKVPTQVLI